MVENVSSVKDVYIDRPRPPEPQERPQPQETRGPSGDGEPTPPNNISLLADGAGAALLRAQEATESFESQQDQDAASQSEADRVLAREQAQRVYEQNANEQATEDNAAANRNPPPAETAADPRARAINIGA